MKKAFIGILLMIFFISCDQNEKVTKTGGWQDLNQEAVTIGKPEWRPMLSYLAELHQKSTHPAKWPFDFEWEEIGPGYIYGPAFGHWDIVHQAIDVMPSYPEHSLRQLLNNIKNQEPHGLIPGSFWMPKDESDSATWSRNIEGHPPVWVFAVDDYIEMTGQDSVLKYFYTPLVRQITWFENSRKAETEGFFYNDILYKRWESGVDEGIRFDETSYGKWACIDATSHVYNVYNLYKIACKWSKMLNLDDRYFKERKMELESFIQNNLYDEEDGLFYDIWAIEDPSYRTLAFETCFPLIVGAATTEQANRMIDEYILDTTCFNSVHPIATVGIRDPRFELRLWRGSAWNSMTYWIARACINYGREDAAKILLEKALDQSAKQFELTGTIWEFYHPFGGDQTDLQRKPQTEKNEPCQDYLGHNPLMAMTRLYENLR